jgi:ubiquinone biosynthesis protein Coq4
MRGMETNPSANAIMALATGLGVNGHDVFTAVTGCTLEEGEVPVSALEFLALMERVALDAELTNAVRSLVGLSQKGRGALMRMLQLHGEESQAGKAERSGSKKKR